MPNYWLDANVFIQSHRGPYSFAIAPGFWTLLERHGSNGVIRCPMEVYHEIDGLLTRNDQLSEWVRDRRELLFVDADGTVQQRYREIGEHVRASFTKPFADKFMNDADSWLIAHAAADGGSVVVTLEVPRGGLAVKIPNICSHFGITCINHYEMLRALGAKLIVE